MEQTKTSLNTWKNIFPLSGKQVREMDKNMVCVLWIIALGSILGPLILITVFISLLFTSYYFIPLGYVAYLFLDRHTPHQGGWRWRPLSSSSFMADFLPEYFPARVHGTTSPKVFDAANKNYLAGVHPHGIMPLSSIVGVRAKAENNFLSRTQLRITGTSHNATFHIPVLREIGLAQGASAASSESIDWLLSGKEGMGNLVGVYPGGAREIGYAEPGTFRLVLKNRMGFVRKALEHGVDLVPCISFGDNEVFHKRHFKEGTFMHKLQDFLIRKSIPVLTFYGDGLFGVLPRRIPLNLIIGAPISVVKIQSPTLEQVKNLHAKYVQEVVDLYESEKSKYGYGDVPIELL